MYVKGCPTPVGCTVRVHDENRLIGDVKGTSYDFAERHENTPIAIFLLEEFSFLTNESFVESGFETFDEVIRRGSVIRIQDDPVTGPAAFEIDAVDPTHGVTQNVSLTRIPKSEIYGYAPPPDDPVTCPITTL